MHTIEITEDQYDRIRALREELADHHADRYTSVTLPDGVAYLLDLAEAVDDPDRTAEVGTGDDAGAVGAGSTDGTDSTDGPRPFPREALEAELTERNRRHTDPEAASRMDLYEIAAEYDVSGRSSMTKGELVTAITEAVERRYTDPLAPVDVDVSGLSPEDKGSDDSEEEIDDGGETVDEPGERDEADDGSTDDGGQLNAMLSLLETHEDKWRSADGDARYEVDLPDGSVEAARTKDDVRAVLFRHY
ncbi:hypothetical protein DJ69_12460 [Halorubrum persicum]|uniref:Rho termination factor-like N-terminal domain-containing protein n=1 Tax=Halorubrum persicum TaxID=1383844 RepID=A0A2G1WH09_9EURY|nr:Rho termination factor N-terminal domain-containing protein [Halorubrum persicum]PHQ38288.1 hypothetical protein DJ69_12460 [Halorubrum persicum]